MDLFRKFSVKSCAVEAVKLEWLIREKKNKQQEQQQQQQQQLQQHQPEQKKQEPRKWGMRRQVS